MRGAIAVQLLVASRSLLVDGLESGDGEGIGLSFSIVGVNKQATSR